MTAIPAAEGPKNKIVVVLKDGKISVEASRPTEIETFVIDAKQAAGIYGAPPRPVRLPDEPFFHEIAARHELEEGVVVKFRDDPPPSTREALGECITELRTLAQLHGADRRAQHVIERATRAYEATHDNGIA